MIRRPAQLPARAEIGADTPLSLDIAAALAFPDGSISGRSLAREAKLGRLTVERIAGKLFTTLGDIARMREQCRVAASRPDSTCENQDAATAARSGSLNSTASNTALARARTISKKLKGLSPNSSELIAGDRPSATIIPIKS